MNKVTKTTDKVETRNTDSNGNMTDKLSPKAPTNEVRATGIATESNDLKARDRATKAARVKLEKQEAEARAAAIEREQARVARANEEKADKTAANNLRVSGRIKTDQL